MSTETEMCRIRGLVSRDSHNWTKLLQKDICGLVWDWQKSKRHHVQITCRLPHGQQLEKPLKEGKNKNGQSRNQNSNTPEIWEEFVLLIRVTKNTKTSLRAQRQLQCHVKERFLKHAHGKPLFQKQKKAKASEAKTRFSCITDPQDKEWSQWRKGFMKNTSREKGLSHITVSCTNLFRCRKRWRFQMQRQQWTRNGTSLRQFQHGM